MEVKQEKTKEARLQRAYEVFLMALLRGRVEDVAQAAYQIFNKPIVILDNAGRVVCLVPNYSIGYPLWDEWLEEGSASLKRNLETLKYYDERLKAGKYAVYIEDRSLGRGIMMRYFKDGICAGHCGVYIGDNVPDETDMEIAELFGKMLTYLYSRTCHGKPSGISYSTFLNDMLLGCVNYTARTIVDYNLKHLLEKRYVVLVGRLPEDNMGTTSGHLICDNIARHHQGTIATVCENHRVTLCCQMNQAQRDCTNDSSRISKIAEYLAGYDIPIGVSALFYDMADIRIYYEQALATLQVGLSLNRQPPFAYEDYIPYQLIRVDLPPGAVLHPTITAIQTYDEKNHTEYLQTYRMYMLCGKDKKYAAIQMYIHVNTLSYRLNLLNDLFGIFEMSKTEELHIILSLLYMDLAGQP